MTALLAQVKNEIQVRVVSDDVSATELRLSFSQKIETAADFEIARQADGLTSLLVEGAPDVPKFAAALVIPNTGNTAVEIVDGKFTEISGIQISPSKGNLSRRIDPAAVPFHFGAAYEKDEFFPGRLADLQQPFIFREVRGQSVWIYPFQYNPKTKVLRVYSEMTLRVVAADGQGENELLASPTHSSRVFQQIFSKTFLNFSTARIEEKGAGGGVLEKMLVIVRDDLQAELEPLLTWKMQSGISVEVVQLSEIGSSEPTEIHNFVAAKYATEGYTYLMIVGDENDFKPEMRQNGGWYACDNCLGYQAGADHLPEILVGRLHASTPDQLKLMVARNLEYEKNPVVDADNNWCATGMAAASNQGAGIGDDGQIDYEHGNEWKAKHLADGFEKYYEFYEGSQSAVSPTPDDPSADQNGDPNSQNLLAVMNGSGVGLWNYTGHGWEQGVVTGNFDVTSVSQMTNVGRYPFVIIVGCCSGNFTIPGGDCLGEAMQRSSDPASGQPTGAICSFMSSDYQSWAPPMEGQDGMNQYLLDADGVNLTPTASAMLAVGNAKMILAYANDGELMADFWNPFTDPSVMPRTRLPQVLLANHSPSVFIGTSSLSVSCDVEGALITLFFDGKAIGSGVVLGGVAVINFDPLTNVGNITVTATQFNYIPYQGPVAVVPASGPFVILQKIELDDKAGNSNGKADFGEKIWMNVQLANIGLVPATATSAKLLIADPKITVLNSDEDFGDIEDSTSVQRDAVFAFSVADDVVDGTFANFKMHIIFSDSMGLDIAVPVKLNAPKLEVPAFKIDDAAPGGNGNGRLDSGEKATVTISNLNKGHANSLLATGILTTSNPYLSISAPFQLGILAAGNGSADAFFTIDVAADAPKSSTAVLDYQVVAGKYVAQNTTGAILINAILEDWEAHNFTTFPWEMTGGNKPWQLSLTGVYEGLYCSRSGTITHNQKSVMSINLNVTEAGTVSFARRVSCEDGYDFLCFKIDDVEIEKWTGVLAWAEVTFPVSKGVHKLSWIYEKDQFGSDGSDRAFVDNILLPPSETIVGTKNISEVNFDLAILPNPATDRAVLRFELPDNQEISIDLFDNLGRKIRTVLPAQNLPTGQQTLPVDLKGLRSGVYFLRMQGEDGSEVLRVVKM